MPSDWRQPKWEIVSAYQMLINVSDKFHEADDDSNANVKDAPHNIERDDNVPAIAVKFSDFDITDSDDSVTPYVTDGLHCK